MNQQQYKAMRMLGCKAKDRKLTHLRGIDDQMAKVFESLCPTYLEFAKRFGHNGLQVALTDEGANFLTTEFEWKEQDQPSFRHRAKE